MLTPEEQRNTVEAMAKVEAFASRVLGRAATAAQAIGFVSSLHANIDTLVASPAPDDLTPACKAGCSFCCSATVEVSDPEALHIAAALRDLPAERLHALVDALRIQAERRAQAPVSERIPCAFLRDGLCSIYTVRPSVCRRAHSLSVAACAQRSPTLPQNLNLLLLCEVMAAGTHHAFQRHGLPAGANELAAAVLAALAHADAAERWFNGTPLLKAEGSALDVNRRVAPYRSPTRSTTGDNAGDEQTGRKGGAEA